MSQQYAPLLLVALIVGKNIPPSVLGALPPHPWRE